MKLRKQRCFAFLLALVLSFSLLGTGAYAAGDGHTYKFSLLADEQVNTLAATGDIVPVKLILTNTTASGNYDLYTMQDYVTFDTSFFELVDGSIETLDGAGLSANGKSFSFGTPDRIYINRTSTTPASVEKEAVLMTFELKVIGTSGTGKIEHDTYFVSKDLSSSTSSAASATVTVGTRQYEIAASAGNGGSISPSGKVKVNKGGNQSFTISANSGYAVEDVTVDGASVGAVTSYSFTDVRCDHSISASFKSVPTGGGDVGGGTGGEITPVQPPVTPQQPSDSSYLSCQKDSSCPVSNFVDTNPNEWYHNGVHYCVENGLMNGIGGGKFNPNGTTTRAMIVTILWRMNGSPAAGASGFADVPANEWYAQAVSWAASCGIVTGYNATTFGPNDSITREQLAAIFYRYANSQGLDVSAQSALAGFTDVGNISDWALTSIRWANSVGLVNGRTSTTIVPGGTATRAESASIIQRFCETVAK